MDREQLLKQEIDKIVAYGKSKGSISEDDIMARLEHLNATAEDMEMVFNALQARFPDQPSGGELCRCL